MNKHVRVWSLQEAKAGLSRLVKLAQNEGPQLVTVHGKAAVTVTSAASRPPAIADMSGSELLKALRKGPLFDFDLPGLDAPGSFED